MADFHTDNYGFNPPNSLPTIGNLAYSNNSHHLPDPSAHYQYNFEVRNTNMYRNYDHGFHMVSHQENMRRAFLTRDEHSNIHPYASMPYSPHSPWAGFESGLNMQGLHLQRNPKQNPKRARMSLHKRLLVNARERERMRVLNKAFEALRDALPCYIADGHMAKITTLRLAINYIKALTDVLNEQKALDAKKGKDIKEPTQEDFVASLLKEPRKDGSKPILKNLGERLAMNRNLVIRTEINK